MRVSGTRINHPSALPGSQPLLALRLTYPAGAFHAAPWTRSLDADSLEWPPSPWRLLRAVVSGWHRAEIPNDDALARVCDALSRAPRFHLPPLVATPARHSTPVGIAERNLGEHALILDAFASSDGREERFAHAYAEWEHIALDDSTLSLLDRALARVDSLGQSDIACALTRVSAIPDDPERIVVDLASCHPIGPTVPRLGVAADMRGIGLLNALRTSDDTLPHHRDNPPRGAVWIDYRFPHHYTGQIAHLADARSSVMPPRVERFRLIAPSNGRLPTVTETVIVAEAMRGAAMRRFSDRHGMPTDLVFAGKGHDGAPAREHEHAFFLPIDLDGDGLIDHLDVWLPRGSTHDAHIALASVEQLYDRGLPLADNARYTLVHEGNRQRPKARSWRTATPFVLERHEKRRGPKEAPRIIDDPASQIIRSLKNHGFPYDEQAVAVEVQRGPLAIIEHREGPSIPAAAYRRARRKDTTAHEGVSAILRFRDPIEGPLILGRLAHFGLGRFSPLDG